MTTTAGTGDASSWLVRGSFLALMAANAFGGSFLPVYARSLHAADSSFPFRLSSWLPPGFTSWLTADVVAGLPISIFWLMVAAAQISTGLWERGRDHRTLFVAASVLATVGLTMAALSSVALELTFWRGIGGLGFGATLILTQDHLIRTMGPAARTRASGVYISLFFTGTIVGTMVGGALADHLGFAGSLAAAAALSALGAGATLAFPSHREPAAPGAFRAGALLRNHRMLALVVFAAIPSRVINAGFVFYIVPLYLHDRGVAQSSAAAVVAVYSLILATTSTHWAALVDRTGRPLAATMMGAALSAAAVAVIPLGWNDFAGAAAAVAVLGLAQAVGMSPQVTVLFAIAKDEMSRFGRTQVLGVYRVSERIGLFLGPMAASALLSSGGYEMALSSLAIMMAVSLAALALAFAVPGKGDGEGEVL